MAKKEFTYRGKNIEELKKLSLSEVMELLPSRARRSLKRGMSDSEKTLLKKIRSKDMDIKTHCRDMIILPEMVDNNIKIHNGKEFKLVTIQPEMIGHCLGEFSMTRSNVSHSSPGIGATKSSSNISVK